MPSLTSKSQRSESNRQPPHYECGALPIEATLAVALWANLAFYRSNVRLINRVAAPCRITMATTLLACDFARCNSSDVSYLPLVACFSSLHWPLASSPKSTSGRFDVKVVPAFPQLEWPEWLRGLDEGKPRDPRPLLLTGAGDGTNRIFVVSEYGTIHVWPNDPTANEMKTFLDIRERVQYDDKKNEEGFLGLAFHPQYKENGEFFVYYSVKPTKEKPHVTVISRFRVSKTIPIGLIRRAKKFSCGSSTVLEPQRRHDRLRAGRLSVRRPGRRRRRDDPHGNGQNLNTLLGKILRIDVDHKDPGLKYAIPKDNPFADRGDEARGEIWAMAFATCGGSRSIARRATCGPATSVRTCGRRSTSFVAAATTAGTCAKRCTRLFRKTARSKKAAGRGPI